MVLILVGFTLITLVDLVPIIRKHAGRGALALLLLLIPALTLAVLRINKIEVPSIMILLGDILKSLKISY